jgi:hypothetical protein
VGCSSAWWRRERRGAGGGGQEEGIRNIRMLESVQEEEEKNIAVASTGRAKKYDDAAQPTSVMGIARDSSGGTPSTSSMATATPSSTALAPSTVEAPPRPPPSAARTSGKLFIYFGLMQVCNQCSLLTDVVQDEGGHGMCYGAVGVSQHAPMKWRQSNHVAVSSHCSCPKP